MNRQMKSWNGFYKAKNVISNLRCRRVWVRQHRGAAIHSKVQTVYLSVV